MEKNVGPSPAKRKAGNDNSALHTNAAPKSENNLLVNGHFNSVSRLI